MNTAFPMSILVTKFGGTSVADYGTMCRSADIVNANSNIQLIVVSASAGITNLLLALAQGPAAKIRKQYLDKIATMQMDIIANIKNNTRLRNDVDRLINNIRRLANIASITPSAALTDELISHGELLSSTLFAEIVKQKQRSATWFDVRQVMRTDATFGNAVPQIKEIKKLCETYLKLHLKDKIIITQGFIGSDADGRTTTLGRGGSDYSAALLGEATNAETIAIWSDVAGIYTADPRIVNSAKKIDEITFSEVAEMATFGAKILHPATLMPASRGNIAIFVGSSQKKELGGTLVCRKAHCLKELPQFRAISLYKNQLLLKLTTISKRHPLDLLAHIINIIDERHLSIALFAASAMGVTLTVHKKDSSIDHTTTSDLINQLAPHCHIEMEENLALVTLIGNHLPMIEGAMTTTFNALRPFSIRFVCYGASQHSICILVDNDNAEAVICKLHSQLFED